MRLRISMASSNPRLLAQSGSRPSLQLPQFASTQKAWIVHTNSSLPLKKLRHTLVMTMPMTVMMNPGKSDGGGCDIRMVHEQNDLPVLCNITTQLNISYIVAA